jgi:DNA-binding LacI/PurR family transcriptional regulator
LPDGTLPTIQNFRQLWKTQYLKALHENRKHIKIVSDEGGTDDLEVDEENYIDDTVIRQHIRELGKKHFEELLDIDELPKLMQQELNQTEYISSQTTISDY